MARIKKDRVKDIAARVVRRPQPKRTPVIVRTGRKEVRTPEYGFDGKVGLWSFTLERPAKRSNVRTGTVVGETMILEDVPVDVLLCTAKNLLARMACFSSCARKCRGSTRPHGTLPYGARVYLAELCRVTSGHSMPNKAASV